MTLAANRASAISLLGLVVALLVGLAPRTVQAHGNHAQREAPAPAAAVLTAKVSPSCPGGSDKACGCGNLLALVRFGSMAVLESSTRHAATAPAIQRLLRPSVQAPRPAFARERPAPRAPPLFS